MHSLPLFMRLVGRPVILLGEGEAAQAKRRLFERAGAVIVGENAAAALAIVAIEDETEALAAIARLRGRGILINAVDRPESCDFTLPAIVDRDPVIVAIGTGGASAGLAKILRQRIEAMLPPSVGALASALSKAREQMRQRWPSADARRRALDTALAAGGPLDPLSGADADTVERWLKSDTLTAPGRLESIHLTSDNPDELTLRAARLLGEADRIYHAADVAPAILNRARADATRIVTAGKPEQITEGLSLWLAMETRT